MNKDNENNSSMPCKLRPYLCNKLDVVFLEMAYLFDCENEKMGTDYVWHEILTWGLKQLAVALSLEQPSSTAYDELKDYVYEDMKQSFDLIIGQREIFTKGDDKDE